MIGTFNMTVSDPKTRDEKLETLRNSKPKSVDEKKYHGAAVLDFKTIKERMQKL